MENFGTKNGLVYLGDGLDCMDRLKDTSKKIVVVTDPPYDDPNLMLMLTELLKVSPKAIIMLPGKLVIDLVKNFNAGFNPKILLSSVFQSVDINYCWSHLNNDLIVLLDRNFYNIINYKKEWENINKYPIAKPLDIFKCLIEEFIDEDEFIVDPFLGSGTTGIVCELLGRRWVGTEINKENFQLCRERLI